MDVCNVVLIFFVNSFEHASVGRDQTVMICQKACPNAKFPVIQPMVRKPVGVFAKFHV